MAQPLGPCTRRAVMAMGVAASIVLASCASVGDVRGGLTQDMQGASTVNDQRVVVVFMDRTQAKAGLSLPALLGRRPAAVPEVQQDLLLLFNPIRSALKHAVEGHQPRLSVHLQSQMPSNALEGATHVMVVNPRNIRRSASSFMADVDVVVRDERLRKALWQGQGEWVRGAAAAESQNIAAGLLRALRESHAIADAALTASAR
jgi:hypothetical protein